MLVCVHSGSLKGGSLLFNECENKRKMSNASLEIVYVNEFNRGCHGEGGGVLSMGLHNSNRAQGTHHFPCNMLTV